jgi:hypothetical protein
VSPEQQTVTASTQGHVWLLGVIALVTRLA